MPQASECLITKLHPKRFPNMSPKMASIVGCVLDQDWTTPRLIHLYETSDHCILGEAEGDVGANHFIGSVYDLKQNWANLLSMAGLTEAELQEASALFRIALSCE